MADHDPFDRLVGDLAVSVLTGSTVPEYRAAFVERLAADAEVAAFVADRRNDVAIRRAVLAALAIALAERLGAAAASASRLYLDVAARLTRERGVTDLAGPIKQLRAADGQIRDAQTAMRAVQEFGIEVIEGNRA